MLRDLKKPAWMEESAMRRIPPAERNIESPVLSHRLSEQVRLLKSEPEWKSGREDGITLAKYPHMRVVLVALKKGLSMREHKIRGPMSLYVMNGRVSLKTDHTESQLAKDGLFTLRKNIPYDIRANTDAVMLMTIMTP